MADIPPEFESQDSEIETKSQDFDSFAKKEGYLQETIEAERRFAIKVADQHRSTNRVYFAQDPSGDFQPIADARISPPFFEFSKFGRRIPGGKGFYSEEESLKFMGEEGWGYETLYTLSHLKGRLDLEGKINNISLRFDKEGKFHILDFEEHNGTIISSSGVIGEELDKHFESSHVPLVRKLSGRSTVVCEKSGAKRVFYLFSPDGKPDYKIVAPEKINVAILMDELGAKKLIANPLQPSDGVPGISNGDQSWRNENFDGLISITVTPTSKPDEEEIDKKGFRALIESVREDL